MELKADRSREKAFNSSQFVPAVHVKLLIFQIREEPAATWRFLKLPPFPAREPLTVVLPVISPLFSSVAPVDTVTIPPPERVPDEEINSEPEAT